LEEMVVGVVMSLPEKDEVHSDESPYEARLVHETALADLPDPSNEGMVAALGAHPLS
jgi:hypothetical protein